MYVSIVFYILKPGYITTAVIIGFIVLSAMGPPVVLYLAEQFSGITDFIMNLSIPVFIYGVSCADYALLLAVLGTFYCDLSEESVLGKQLLMFL
ncbi:hypothetical protein BsIDN1_03460 [Bacillus safensis]|uniref:Uncharacterized protein n=1 Tax=Bacillus safensis TaxID=561879 RepID=A0A5S9M215_BACIA|nr:hypothetical protein BsIDN1_03460 [Bacillus safensis]